MGILEVKNVNKRFGGLQALGDVNLSVAEHSVHAIIGPNGAGKSTLLNVLIGKLIPDTGSVLFDGHSVLGRKPYQINQMGISRVFQTPEIFGDLTVLENMMIPIFAMEKGALSYLLGKLSWLGEISYSVYLNHLALLLLARTFLTGINPLLFIAIYLAAVLICSHLTYVYVEGPARRAIRKLAEHPTPAKPHRQPRVL